MRDETSGRSSGIQKVKNDSEAVGSMNDANTAYAGVYTPDEKRWHGAPVQVHAGSAYWNCCDRVSPRCPGRVSGTPGSAHAVHLRHPDFHAGEGVASFRCIVRGPSPGSDRAGNSIRNLDDQ